MSYFEFQNAVKLLCGELSLERIANELQHLHAERPLVLSDAVLAKIGTMAAVTDAMVAEGVKPAATFTDIPVDSSLAVVNKIAAFYRGKVPQITDVDSDECVFVGSALFCSSYYCSVAAKHCYNRTDGEKLILALRDSSAKKVSVTFKTVKLCLSAKKGNKLCRNRKCVILFKINDKCNFIQIKSLPV